MALAAADARECTVAPTALRRRCRVVTLARAIVGHVVHRLDVVLDQHHGAVRTRLAAAGRRCRRVADVVVPRWRPWGAVAARAVPGLARRTSKAASAVVRRGLPVHAAARIRSAAYRAALVSWFVTGLDLVPRLQGGGRTGEAEKRAQYKRRRVNHGYGKLAPWVIACSWAQQVRGRWLCHSFI